MAGRRPTESRDGQAGQDPLNPPRQPRRKPGMDGNVNGMKNGMKSSRAIKDRAMAIITAMLEDARCPDHLRSPAFLPELMAWGRAEAVSSLAYDWMCDMLDTEGPMAVFGMQPGMVKSLSDVWKGHEAAAAQRRAALGISPASYAKIARNLGLAAAATGDQLARMKESGGEIARRRLGMIQGGKADEAV